jgi:hypothetical protein
MNPVWPSIEVIKDFQVAPDGSVATAHTELYLQGRREHLYTSTMLIAVDLLLTKFLNEGEQLEPQPRSDHCGHAIENPRCSIPRRSGLVSHQSRSDSLVRRDSCRRAHQSARGIAGRHRGDDAAHASREEPDGRASDALGDTGGNIPGLLTTPSDSLRHP